MDLSTQSKKYNVAIPTYNTRPAYLESCLHSIAEAARRWDASKVEATIVSDGSEHTLNRAYSSICERLSGQLDTRFIVNSRNSGIANARNTAIKASAAEWHILVDSDDALVPNFFEVVDRALEPNHVFAFTDHMKVSEDLERCLETRRKAAYAAGLRADMGSLRDPFLNFTFLIHCHVLNRSLFDRIGFFNEAISYGDEIDFHLRCTVNLAPQEVLHIPEVLYVYRDNTDGVCHNATLYAELITTIEHLLLHEANRRGGGFSSCHRRGKTEDGAVEYTFA